MVDICGIRITLNDLTFMQKRRVDSQKSNIQFNELSRNIKYYILTKPKQQRRKLKQKQNHSKVNVLNEHKTSKDLKAKEQSKAEQKN